MLLHKVLKKSPITHLSPKSIAVSAPLCCNYFCCHVRACVSLGGRKAVSRWWEVRCVSPPGMVQQRCGMLTPTELRLCGCSSLLRCKHSVCFWRRGGGFSSSPLFWSSSSFPMPVSKCLLSLGVSHGALLIDGKLFPRKSHLQSLHCCSDFVQGQSLPQLSCSGLCSAGQRLPITLGYCAVSISASPSAGISTTSHPSFIPQKTISLSTFPCFQNSLTQGFFFKPYSPSSSLLFLALLK